MARSDIASDLFRCEGHRMMASEVWLQIATIGIAVTGSLLVLFDDRRLLVFTLAVQYALVAFLISYMLNVQIAAAKLVAGMVSCVIFLIYLRTVRTDPVEDILRTIPFNRLFRVLAVLLVLLVAIGVSTGNLVNLEGLPPEIGTGTALLICLSFLHLGLCEEPLRVGIGLLTFLSGFEITYSILEPSLAVVGLLASVHVGIALVCGYLTLVHDIDQSETRL
jgi:hypothetical protein